LSSFYNSYSNDSALTDPTLGNIAILKGKLPMRAKRNTAVSKGTLIIGDLGYLPNLSNIQNIIAGETKHPTDRNILEVAVSLTAFFAHTFDIPTFYVIYSSAKTSIPFSISLLLMQNELRNPALPLAVAEIKELTKISLLPVTD
jgi:hypothetical protein